MEVTDPAQLAQMTNQALATCTGNKFEFNVVGHDLQLVEVILKPGDKIIAESGSLCFLEPDITFESQFNDGSRPEGSWWENFKDVGKRLLAGTSMSMLHIENLGCAVKELKLSYYIGETLLFTIYTHYGNLI